MTTASISAPSLIDDTWLNQDCEQRLSTLEKLDSNESSTADFLLKVALEDDFEKVRSSAISRIVDLEALAKLGAAGGKAKKLPSSRVVVSSPAQWIPRTARKREAED